MEEDWWVLQSLLPSGWRELGRVSGALKGLRTAKSAEVSLRVLLLHLGCGHSLRETSVRARESGLARLSDVAVLKRLRKSSGWLRGLCAALLRERGAAPCGGFEVRTFDATTVREPGRTCPSATPKAPAPGSTASSSSPCWPTRQSATPAPFPPGDTTWRRRRTPSPWREFRFVLNQMRNAIEPRCALKGIFNSWNAISHALAEPPRRRKPQLNQWFEP